MEQARYDKEIEGVFMLIVLSATGVILGFENTMFYTLFSFLKYVSETRSIFKLAPMGYNP